MKADSYALLEFPHALDNEILKNCMALKIFKGLNNIFFPLP